jgi:RNA polymerase sigma factor (sigma-70 family)
LLRTELDFVPHESFVGSDLDAAEAIERSGCQVNRSDAAPAAPNGLPAHLARLCESRLLTAEQERALFRTMNYLKYRVNVLRSQLDPQTPDLELIDEAERSLRSAMAIRDRIVESNMRLVVSIVKKFVTPQYSFDELLSDGIDTLIQAVAKFDVSRGFRFSTYAYRSITRRVCRQSLVRQKQAPHATSTIDELATTDCAHSELQLDSDASWDELPGMLDKMLARLDRRERFIVRRRYALGSNRKSATFQSMANKLGVSKERVRQLENRAIKKLRVMAAGTGLADLLE